MLAVGLLTVVDPGAFPDETVWSQFGRGYAFLPLVLPVAALAWLRLDRPREAAARAATTTGGVRSAARPAQPARTE